MKIVKDGPIEDAEVVFAHVPTGSAACYEDNGSERMVFNALMKIRYFDSPQGETHDGRPWDEYLRGKKFGWKGRVLIETPETIVDLVQETANRVGQPVQYIVLDPHLAGAGGPGFSCADDMARFRALTQAAFGTWQTVQPIDVKV